MNGGRTARRFWFLDVYSSKAKPPVMATSGFTPEHKQQRRLAAAVVAAIGQLRTVSTLSRNDAEITSQVTYKVSRQARHATHDTEISETTATNGTLRTFDLDIHVTSDVPTIEWFAP
ncbi:hypothetical protein J6590_040242 [Homalodisca vitripennis]|nr:hypothetical protein J6590_040242 [Homalodisca vitripennis]